MRIAPDSNTRIGSGPLRSTIAGIFELGLMLDKAAAELVVFEDLDQPGIVFGGGDAELEQLLEHDRDLLAVGRAERIELEGMLAHGQLRLAAGAPAVGRFTAGKRAAVGLVPGPDFGGT